MESFSSESSFKVSSLMPRTRPRSAPRLGPDDWERAALAVLEAEGFAAVTIARVARELGVTKGSFYWHYENRDDLIASMLEVWERQSTDAAIEALRAITDPRVRIETLFGGAGDREPTIHRRLRAAADDPLVAAVLQRSTERRLEGLAKTFRELGMAPAQARDRAALAYATYLGLADLRGEGPPALASRRGARRLGRAAAALVLPE